MIAISPHSIDSIAAMPLFASSRSGASGYGVWFLVAVAAIAALWAAVFLSDFWRRRGHVPSGEPIDLFNELCDAHRLNRAERQSLTVAATTLQLSNSSLLFVDSELLRKAALANDATSATFRSLSERLFSAR